MKAILIFILFIAIFIRIVVRTNAQRDNSNAALPQSGDCGRLKEEYLYSEESITALDEFPWIGRIAFTAARSQTSSYKCLAVLIGRRHLLANAQCFRNIKRNEPKFVLLGDWNASNNASEPDCNEAEGCAPPPRTYEIDEIALHPDFDSRDKVSDIAVLALTTAVELSEHVQPICLPPVGASGKANFVAQYLPYAGFQVEGDGDADGVEKRKKKTLAHVLSTERCRERFGIGVTDEQLCVTCNSAETFQSGAPLMGVSVEDSKPRRFYLIGLLSFGRSACSTKSPDVVQLISPYHKWINDNVV